MHPDSLKSVVYRSFVTCDDPKGVVECGTIRKSKSSSHKTEHKNKSQKAKKKTSDATFSSEAKKKEEMVSKGISEELLSPSSFQLLEVSRGAQKLNQMIDAWSKGKTFGEESKDVAKDLLKGALDLQESLIMLGKLQEASQYMAWLKKKQKKSDRRMNNELGIERANSYHFGEQNHQMGFQKPRFSADGSSRDCIDELRNAIRDGLARQNLLPKRETEEKMGFHQRHLDLASEIASTSSSQSSITHTNNYSSTDSPLSSATPEKKAKSPNLIAKLMGLEEFPSKPLQKQLKNEKISSQQRPMFDFDMPGIRKPQSVRQHEKPEHGTLKEILETMHFTGLLKSNSVKELKSHPHHSSDSHAKQSSMGNTPPIVLIKPLRGQFLESKEPFAPMFQEKDVQHPKMMLKELKVKEEFPNRTAERKEKVSKSGKISRKKETEDTPIKRPSKEEVTKEIKKIAEKPEEVKIKQKGSNKKNASGHVTQQPQKKEVIDKKSDDNLKAMLTSRKPAEKEIEKAKNVSSSRDQVKATATKIKKPESGSNVSKNQTHRQNNGAPNTMLNHTKQKVSQNSNDRKKSLIKGEKPVREPTAAKSKGENVGSKEDDKKIDFTSESDSVLIESNDSGVDQLPAQEETDSSEFHIGEHYNNSQSSLDDAVLMTSQSECDSNFVEELNDGASHIIPDGKSFESETDPKLLLLSNSEFLSHAEELFDLDVNCPTSLQTSGIDVTVVINERLSLDIANELMERISLPDSKMVHPLLLTWLRKPRIYISLDKLLEEVYDGVENLESYTKLADETENLPTDSLFSLLEKDIRCKGIGSGIWDLGWRNEFSTDDIEHAVNDIEKLLLIALIDELIT